MLVQKTHNTVENFLEDYKKLISNLYTIEECKILLGIKLNESKFLCGIVIERGNKLIGCIALLKSNTHSIETANSIYFSFFECEESFATAEYIFLCIQEILNKFNCSKLIGPINGSTWDVYRLKASGFENHYLSDCVNKNYYPQFLELLGFKSIANYITNRDEDFIFNKEKIDRAKKSIEPLNLNFRNIKLDDFESDLFKLYTFCLNSFKNNFLYSPISFTEFFDKYILIKNFIIPEFVIFAEDVEGLICGMIFGFPNLLDKQNKGLIIKTLAKSPGIKYAGLGTVLSELFYQRARTFEAKNIIHAFMHQSNESKNISNNFSGKQLATYSLYCKQF